jgi:hypothetical protein
MMQLEISKPEPFMSLQGCTLVVQAFFMRFQAMTHTVDQGEIMKLLIHALVYPYCFFKYTVFQIRFAMKFRSASLTYRSQPKKISLQFSTD